MSGNQEKKTKTEVERCYTKRFDRDWTTEGSTKPENLMQRKLDTPTLSGQRKHVSQ